MFPSFRLNRVLREVEMMRKSGITESETRNCNARFRNWKFPALFGTLEYVASNSSEDGRNKPPSSVINSAVTVTTVLEFLVIGLDDNVSGCEICWK